MNNNPIEKDKITPASVLSNIRTRQTDGMFKLLRVLCLLNFAFMVIISVFIFKNFSFSKTKWDTLMLSSVFIIVYAVTFLKVKKGLAVFLYCQFVIGEQLHMMHLFGVSTSFHISIILLVIVIFYDSSDKLVRNILYSVFFNVVAILSWLLIQKTDNILPITYTDLFTLSIINTSYIMVIICVTIHFYYRKTTEHESALMTYANKLEEMAVRDSLTDLLNRRGMFEKYRELKTDDATVVMCDIDFFKNVNDSYGHDIGDLVLQMVAGMLSQCDQFAISRWGGEEFLLLFDSVDKDKIFRLLDDCRIKIQNAHIDITNDKSVSVTISFGAYSFDRKDENLESAIAKADDNLYESKMNGRNKITYK